MIISMEGLSLSHVYIGLLAMAISVVLVLLAGKPSIKPTKFQALWEGYIRFVRGMVIENMGHEGLRYVPLISAIGLFVFFSNLLGMVPGLDAPTANVNTNLALALIVFLFYNIEGFRLHGVGYLKHFMGPSPLLGSRLLSHRGHFPFGKTHNPNTQAFCQHEGRGNDFGSFGKPCGAKLLYNGPLSCSPAVYNSYKVFGGFHTGIHIYDPFSRLFGWCSSP
jgi:hypothetical protein